MGNHDSFNKEFREFALNQIFNDINDQYWKSVGNAIRILFRYKHEFHSIEEYVGTYSLLRKNIEKDIIVDKNVEEFLDEIQRILTNYYPRLNFWIGSIEHYKKDIFFGRYF